MGIPIGPASAWAMSAMAKSTLGTMWVSELKMCWSTKPEEELRAGSQVDVTLETCEISAVMTGRENIAPAAAVPMPSKRDIPIRISGVKPAERVSDMLGAWDCKGRALIKVF